MLSSVKRIFFVSFPSFTSKKRNNFVRLLVKYSIIFFESLNN